MSGPSKAVALLASAGVLAIGWQVGAARQQALDAVAPPAPTTEEAPTATPTEQSSTTRTPEPTIAPTVASTPTASASAPTPSTPSARTLTGATVSHKYGTVKVTATLTDRTITNVTARTTSVDSKSTTITREALSVLRSRVLAANSAEVTTVSGATYTSDAYLTSLQSALDKA